MESFGRTISDARKALGLSQKELAGRIRKEDGEAISAQYLNDIEHDRRSPSSQVMIEQLARELKLKPDVLYISAGTIPSDLSHALSKAAPDTVEEAVKAFRKVLKGR